MPPEPSGPPRRIGPSRTPATRPADDLGVVMPDTDGGPRPAAAVLLAAGEGKRMRSALPKVMHPIGGVTLLGHAAAAVATLQPEHLAVVVGHGREEVSSEVEALGRQLGRPLVAAVQEQQLGTGHAVRCGLEALPAGLAGAVVVTYADVPLLDAGTLRVLLAEHASAGGGRHAAHRRVRRSDRVRPGAARDGRRGHRHRRARATPRRSSGRSARSTAACTRSTPRPHRGTRGARRATTRRASCT